MRWHATWTCWALLDSKSERAFGLLALTRDALVPLLRHKLIDDRGVRKDALNGDANLP